MEAAVAATPTGLRIQGRVDFRNADELCAEGSRLLAGRAEQVSVDLEHLDHAGSVVIAILMAWANASEQALCLVALPKSMRRVLEFTGMDELFVYSEPSVLDVPGSEHVASDAVRSVAGGLPVDALVQTISDVGKESNR